jgi:hypothetical protein
MVEMVAVAKKKKEEKTQNRSQKGPRQWKEPLSFPI